MKYILAADDEPVNLCVIEEVLMDDYEVLCVKDGVECLASIQERVPDLLLLDVAMPEKDGLSVCLELRKNELTKELPIILLSGFAAPEHIEQGLAAGANSYISKPFEPETLRQAILKLIR